MTHKEHAMISHTMLEWVMGLGLFDLPINRRQKKQDTLARSSHGGVMENSCRQEVVHTPNFKDSRSRKDPYNSFSEEQK